MRTVSARWSETRRVVLCRQLLPASGAVATQTRFRRDFSLVRVPRRASQDALQAGAVPQACQRTAVCLHLHFLVLQRITQRIVHVGDKGVESRDLVVGEWFSSHEPKTYQCAFRQYNVLFSRGLFARGFRAATDVDERVVLMWCEPHATMRRKLRTLFRVQE